MLVFAIAWSASVVFAAQSAGVMEELRESLFQAANQALAEANEASANLLSPTRYASAAESYRRAESTLERGGNIESIRRDLAEATEAFLSAAEHAALAATTFAGALAARDDAFSAGAESYASEEWEEARDTFVDATVRLENGRLERAQRDGANAERQFRDAELVAIKANYLNETRELLELARDENAPRYAPQSYERAEALLTEAEDLLETSRYDTDTPRSLASDAKHQVLHAIYVARLEQAIRSRDLSLESILLDWEASIRSIADQLDLAVHFDEGQEAAVEEISASITDLQSRNSTLRATLTDRDVQLDALTQETASMERLSRLVARQERQKKKMATVEALFSESEAIVLRQADSIILRMIGLSFDLGKAELKPEHDVLLNNLRIAISEFPESSVVVEGHTDAFGTDTNNLALSQRRAEALQQYLLENTPISPGNLTALGYGEARPVANNETEEGRRRNRRIDVIIYPKW
jgi:outer membrane protein OmpA-like peptidoglycan-associated protein